MITDCFGQEISVQNSTKTIFNDYELSEKQYAAWKSIQNNWLVNDYEVVQIENKIKLNCKDCESFYIDPILTVNPKGKL